VVANVKNSGLQQEVRPEIYGHYLQWYWPSGYLVVRTTADPLKLAPVLRSEPQPWEADIKITRDLIRAGQLLKIEVLDHVIMGNPNHCSLRELGYFL
jgi:hypothetical protein